MFYTYVVQNYICRTSRHIQQKLQVQLILLALLLQLLKTENLTSDSYSRVIDWSGNYSRTLDWSSLSCFFIATGRFLSLLIYSMKIHMLNHLQEAFYCNFGSAAFLCRHISYFNVTYWIKLLLSILLSYTSTRGNINSHTNAHINMYAWNMLPDVAWGYLPLKS